MAYPFVEMPTVGQFVRRACDDYGCTHEKGAVTLFGPDGESRVSALSRGENGERKVVVLPFRDDDERLTPHLTPEPLSSPRASSCRLRPRPEQRRPVPDRFLISFAYSAASGPCA